MRHEFQQSRLDATKCIHCSVGQTEHTCEVCGGGPDLTLYKTILFCDNCLAQEKALERVSKSESESRVEKLRKEDFTIKVTTDIFNAKIASIEELRKAIEQDENIPVNQKYFVLGRNLEDRYKHIQAVIVDGQNEQRAIQTYYNELAKKLSAEQREQIKLTHTEYQPPTKAAKAPKEIKVKKYDKNSIREASQKSGLMEQLIQMTCVARNVTPMEAVHILREAGA